LTKKFWGKKSEKMLAKKKVKFGLGGGHLDLVFRNLAGGGH